MPPDAQTRRIVMRILGMQQVSATGTTFTGDASPRSKARRRLQARFPMLVPFPIACFVGALVTDLAYWRTPEVLWERFSIWLIAAGLVVAGFAVIVGVIDFATGKRIRTLAWSHAVGYVLALALSLINAFVHSRDGYTAVVPTGLMLSGLVVVILLVTGWLGSTSMYRHRTGAAI
jgi:uncharacterized membrane protein